MSAMNSPVVVPVVPVVEKTKGRGKKAKVSTEHLVDAVVEEKPKAKGRVKKGPNDLTADAVTLDAHADKPRKNLIAKHALLHAFTLHLAKTSLDSGLFDQLLFDRFLASHSFFLDIPSLSYLFDNLDLKNLLKNAKIACKTSRKPTVSPDAPSLPAKKAKKEKVVKEKVVKEKVVKEKVVKEEGEVKEKKPRKPRQPKVAAPVTEGEAAPAATEAVKEKKPRAKKTKAAEVVDEIPPATTEGDAATEAPPAEATEAPPAATEAVKEKKARQSKAKKEAIKPEAEPVAVVEELAAESHEGELEVRELVFEGVTYLLDDSNILYANDDTFEVVGKYDPLANAVVLNK